MKEWHAKYKDEEFTIVAVHYPEFGYEEDVDNVRQFALDNGLEYPIAIDNDGVTWRSFRQRFWPTRYLIDRTGQIRYKHIGEGGYEETDRFIQQLLDETEPPTS